MTRRAVRMFLVVVAAVFLPTLASAQQVSDAAAVETVDEVEINRDAGDLRRYLDVRPDDVDVTDTVLVFTNVGTATHVTCIGYDKNGHRVGRARTRIPQNGLGFLLASDISNGRDFIGHVGCATDGRVIPSAFLVGAGGVTHLSARGGLFDHSQRIRVPVVVTF